MAYEFDTTKRFSGLAELYDAGRPSYPSQAIDHIIASAKLNKDSIIADIGCGTGISSRLFAKHDIKVLGLEPNNDMRKKAEELNSADSGITYINAGAENTALPDSSIDLVLAAQAFHWFDPDKALSEFARILKNNAYCALMWNERDESDEFTHAYGDIARTWPETKSVEMNRGDAGIALLQSSLFKNASRKTFFNQQEMTENDLITRALSTSYSPKEPQAIEILKEQLKKLFAKSQRNEQVIMRYETSVYFAQKK